MRGPASSDRIRFLIVEPLAEIRTRLNPFSDEEQEQLINWGYALCDAAMRTHVPEIIATRPRPN
jgi:NTE family protein